MHLSMFTIGNPYSQYPKLKGRAAEVRGLAAPLLHCWEMFASRVNVQHVQISPMLRPCVEMEAILTRNKDCVRLPLPDRLNFQRFGFEYLVLFNALGAFL